MDNQTLASEMLHELKASNQRWFIAFLVVLALWFLTIGVFIWYISLPVEEYTISQEADEDSYNQIIGGDYGFSSEGNLPQESNSLP